MSDESEDRDDVRTHWLRHEHTQFLKRLAAKHVDEQIKHLLGACAKSADAEVRGHYQRYVELKAQLILLSEGEKK